METPQQFVIAGAGYAGLHVALRLAARRDKDVAVLTLIDQDDYHQVITELPRVAAGTRSAEAVRLPVATMLQQHVTFIQARVTGFDLAQHRVHTDVGPLPYTRLVLALGSRSNDFGIPGLRERTLSLYRVDDAAQVWAAVTATFAAAADAPDPIEQRRLSTIVIGGGGATGVELAGELAAVVPTLAQQHGLAADRPRIVLVEAGSTILAGSSMALIRRATDLLNKLHVIVRTNAIITSVSTDGFDLKSGETITGSVFVWAGGVTANDVVKGSGLPIGRSGRVKVDRYLRALDHPEVYVAGDMALVIDPTTGHALPPLAQTALDEGETVAHNLWAEAEGAPLVPFQAHNRGLVVSVGQRDGVADIGGHTLSGRLAHALKDAIEWEYRQSVKHLRGWSVV